MSDDLIECKVKDKSKWWQLTKCLFPFLGESVTDDEIIQFIADADLDGDGKINYEEFYSMMSMSLH